jgi:hypothetical protein
MDDETLRRLVRSQTDTVPASRADCPSPDALQSAATDPRGDAAQLLVLEHVATCAPCRRDFNLLRTAHAAAPVARRSAMPRWIPALAAATLVIVVSMVAFRDTDTVVRGGDSPRTGVPLLPPAISRDGVTLRWASVADAVSYRVEVTDRDGAVAYSAETADTVAVAPLVRGTDLRWAVEARLLDGTVRTSKAEMLPTPP